MARGPYQGTWRPGIRPTIAHSPDAIVYINGDALTSNGGLAIHYNSADISGDGSVNLTDAGFFTGFLGGSDYDGDFNNDGEVNTTNFSQVKLYLEIEVP